MSGRIYAHELKINLKSQKESEIFRWFLACLLFGKPIQQEVAKRTYFEFLKFGLGTPEKILDAGWDRLVEILDIGHYVRYDFSTATKLQEIMIKLYKEYGGEITNIIKLSKNKNELNKLLQDFKGIGPKTAEIFLRELKG